MKADSEQYRLWDAFLKEWPIERLRTMSLEEYASVGDDKSFIRWLESRLSEMGSIWGGSAFKFGIYKRKAEEEKEAKAGRTYSGEYAWYTKYGNSAEQAFAKVRGLVVDVATAAQTGDLGAIDEIDLGPAFKWKIAFHYQNRASSLITAVFTRELLQAYLGEKLGQNTPYSKLYRQIITSRNGMGILEFGQQVWERASEKLAAMFNPANAENLLKARYKYFGTPTKKLAGFVTPGGRNLALRRDGRTVRAYVEANFPTTAGVTIRENYRANQERSSNLPSQAPNLAEGHEAALVQFDSAEALTTFCDAYDEPIDLQGNENEEQPKMPRERGVSDGLNLILYGPPGTGKTFKTAEMAVEICDGRADEDRAALMRRYEELRKEGRIRFVTFHQSYSYEDFVEGLRPESKDGQVVYRVRPGVFREVCDAARRSRMVKPGLQGRPLRERTIYKMSLGPAGTSEGNQIFQEAMEKGYVLLGWGENVDFSQCRTYDEFKSALKEQRPDLLGQESQAKFPLILKNEVKTGDIIVASQGNRAFRAIGEITGEYEFLETATFHQARPVRWLAVFEGNRGVEEIYDRAFMQSSLYKLDPLGLKLDALEALLRLPGEAVNQPFVLIVDEINRANISKVIGELITLIETDKREGAPNALTLKLPISGEDFSVPANLFILGTMNTADRSIALLDTALRRRFDFIELRPDPDELSDALIDGIDLGAMLTALNRRIEYLYDRDHAIGHAYFMNLQTLEALDNVMRHRIIPLLQEYFYEDWSKIRLALNDHASLFLEDGQVTLDTRIVTDDFNEPKARYRVRETPFPVQAYLSIYS